MEKIHVVQCFVIVLTKFVMQVMMPVERMLVPGTVVDPWCARYGLPPDFSMRSALCRGQWWTAGVSDMTYRMIFS